jgi:hypothetical protein
VAERLLAKPENAIVLGRRLIAGHLDKSLLPQVKEALGRYATANQGGQVKSVLDDLQKLAP